MVNTFVIPAYGKPTLLSFPKDETEQSWLPTLLKSYFIADKGVYEAVQREQKLGRTLACAKGCAHCCQAHLTIPIYPLELVGLYWYAIEKIQGRQRELLKQQLRQHRKDESCPFLIANVCAIHPMRPLACRHFNVLDKICEAGEDAFYTRRQNVLTPIRKYQQDALAALLPYHGMKRKAKQLKYVQSGEIHKHIQVLQSLVWQKLAVKMESYDVGKMA